MPAAVDEAQPIRVIRQRIVPQAPVCEERFAKWNGYGRFFVNDAANLLYQSLRNQTRLCFLTLLAASYEEEGRLVKGLSQADIAGLLGCSRRSVRNCLHELETVGLIERIRRWGWTGKDPRKVFRRPGHVNNHYRVHLPSEVCPMRPIGEQVKAVDPGELVPATVAVDTVKRQDAAEAAAEAELRTQEQLAAQAQVRGLAVAAGAARRRLEEYAQRVADIRWAPEPLGPLRFIYPELCSGALTARQRITACLRALRGTWLAVAELSELAEGLAEPPRDGLGRPTWPAALTRCRAVLSMVDGLGQLITEAERANIEAADGWVSVLMLPAKDRPRPSERPRTGRPTPRRPETSMEFEEFAEEDVDEDLLEDFEAGEPTVRAWAPPKGVRATPRQWLTWADQWVSAEDQAPRAPEVAARVQRGLRSLGFDPGWPLPPGPAPGDRRR